MLNIKITLGNYTYQLKKTTGGVYYIARSFSYKGFKKWEKGILQNKSGIINLF